MDSMDVPDQEIPRQEPRQEQVHNQERSQNERSHDRDSGNASSQNRSRNDHFRFPIDQIKNMLPPEQQSRLETAQMLMQTFQQFS